MVMSCTAEQLSTQRRAERRAAPKPARIPSGDGLAYPTDQGLT
jgi:hypothetical protein